MADEIWIYDSMENEQLEMKGVSIRDVCTRNRVMANQLIKTLVATHGDLDNVPRTNPTLIRARFLLGSHETILTVSDVKAIRSRILALASRSRLPVTTVAQRVALPARLTVADLWRKLAKNEFTTYERRLIWQTICQMEREV